MNDYWVDENFSGEPEIGEAVWEAEQEGMKVLRAEMEKENSSLRPFTEIGSFENVSDDVNKAFQLYASAYLNCVDDNMQHFVYRDIDMAPLTDRGISWDMKDEKAVVDAYVSAAKSILSVDLEHGVSGSQLMHDYPTLKDFGVHFSNDYDQKRSDLQALINEKGLATTEPDEPDLDVE